MKRILSLVIPIAMTASMFVACKSGNGSSTTSGGGGGGGSTASQSAAKGVGGAISYVQSLNPIMAGGAIRPAATVNITGHACPSGGTLDETGTFNQSGTGITGSVSVTFHNCVIDGYTFGSGWTENFAVTYTGTTTIVVGGTITATGTIAISGPSVSVPSCAVSITDTFNETIVTSPSVSYSGSFSYSGSACGSSGSGSCTFSSSGSWSCI